MTPADILLTRANQSGYELVLRSKDLPLAEIFLGIFKQYPKDRERIAKLEAHVMALKGE